jgi:hypothetical protein
MDAGDLFNKYMEALVHGNPFAVVPTLVVGVALSVGPFYEGIKVGDPAAIGLMIGVGVMLTLLIVIAVIDRKNNGPKKQASGKNRAKAGSRR